MGKDFPHLSDTNFPNLDNVNVWEYKNNFDYTRWVPGTKLKLCNVNFCSGYENVVKFENDTARDAYFDSMTGQVIDLVSDIRLQQNVIKLPVPFDILNQYNYIVVDFPIATSAGALIDYESVNGKRRYFYFIVGSNAMAPSVTECMLQLDVWTTYINDAEFKYALLDRGHVAFEKCADVDSYLANPLENSSYLLADDVNFGDANIVSNTTPVVFNDGDMYICFATTSYVNGNWGTKAGDNWRVPYYSYAQESGLPTNIDVFCIAVDEYSTFMGNIQSNYPQFAQTVQAIFILPDKLISRSTSFTFAGVTCWRLQYSHKFNIDFDLTKSMFNYEDNYKDLTKLYTFPYSHLEISDEEGHTTEVHIEDTSQINIDAVVSHAFPYVNIQAMLTGIGGNNKNSVSFKNLSTHSFVYGGKSYENLHTWNVPVYGFVQGAGVHNDYNTYYEREQQLLENTSKKSNEIDYARKAYWDTTTTSELARLNRELTAKLTDDQWVQHMRRQNYNRAQGNYLNRRITSEEVENAQFQFSNNVAQTAVNSAASFVSTGSPMSAVYAGSNALFGNFSVSSSIGLQESVSEEQRRANNQFFDDMYGGETLENLTIENLSYRNVVHEWNKYSESTVWYSGIEGIKAQNQKVCNYRSATGGSDSAKYMRDNAYNLIVGGESTYGYLNALTDTALTEKHSTDYYGIADRNKETADAGVQASIDSKEIDAAITFGENKFGDNAAIRPQALFFNVVTQRKDEIAQTGDYFLRYGYAMNRNIEIDDLNVMSKFTYWKMEDMWLNGIKGIIENVQEQLKAIFYKGVTVWRNNDEIGQVSIYENGLINE